MDDASGADEQRFTAIFDDCYPSVVAYVRRRIPPDDVQDVVGATFLAAWRHLDAVSARPLPWLYRAASLEIANHRRSSDRRSHIEFQIEFSDPSQPGSDPADQVVLASHWRDAFSRLGSADQEVLRLVAWEGVTPGDGALAAGCSLIAFKVRVHRARLRLVRLLELSDAAGDADQPPASKEAFT